MPFLTETSSPTLEQLFSLKGRTILVSGGAGLLGSQISAALAELGGRLVIGSRDGGKCEDFAAELRRKFPGAAHEGMQLDITSNDSVNAMMAHLGATSGLDVLVNCSWSGRKNTFESISEADWTNDIEVSLNSVFRMCKAAVPLLAKRPGVIVNISSMYGIVAPDHRLYDGARFANPPSYGAAKAGVLQFTRYMASFLAPQGIRANCISPGPFPYESTQKEAPEFIERLSGKNPMNRIGKPFELKGAAALLCSDASSYMTGQNISVDGGWTSW